MADPTLKATLTGTITIGTGANTISFPVTTDIPPTTPGDFEFAIPPAAGAEAKKIPVGEFITWAATQIDPDLNSSNLPTSLQTLNVAVEKLSFNTKGNFDIQVEIGKMDGTPPVWDPSWQPIPGLDSFKITNVTLEVKRTPAT